MRQHLRWSTTPLRFSGGWGLLCVVVVCTSANPSRLHCMCMMRAVVCACDVGCACCVVMRVRIKAW